MEHRRQGDRLKQRGHRTCGCPPSVAGPPASACPRVRRRSRQYPGLLRGACCAPCVTGGKMPVIVSGSVPSRLRQRPEGKPSLPHSAAFRCRRGGRNMVGAPRRTSNLPWPSSRSPARSSAPSSRSSSKPNASSGGWRERRCAYFSASNNVVLNSFSSSVL